MDFKSIRLFLFDMDGTIYLGNNLFPYVPELLRTIREQGKNYTELLAGAHRNICVVGDDDQSIYRFRGATIENILSFEHRYAESQIIRLDICLGRSFQPHLDS